MDVFPCEAERILFICYGRIRDTDLLSEFGHVIQDIGDDFLRIRLYGFDATFLALIKCENDNSCLFSLASFYGCLGINSLVLGHPRTLLNV